MKSVIRSGIASGNVVMRRAGLPEYLAKEGTTVSAGSTELSSIMQQSFRTHLRPCNIRMNVKVLLALEFTKM